MTRMLQLILALAVCLALGVSCSSKSKDEEGAAAAQESGQDDLGEALAEVSGATDDNFEDDDEDIDDEEDIDSIETDLAREELGDSDIIGSDVPADNELDDGLTADLADDQDIFAGENQADDSDLITESDVVNSSAGTSSAGGFNSQVTDLQYVSFKKGGTLVIKTSTPVKYRVQREIERNQVVIELPNTELPSRFKRPYVTKDFQQKIANVNAYQNSGATTARFVLQLQTGADAIVEQQGNSIMVVGSQVAANDLGDDLNGGVVGDDGGGFSDAIIGSDLGDIQSDSEEFLRDEIAEELPEETGTTLAADEKPLATDQSIPGQALSADDIANRPISLLKRDSDKFFGNPISIEVQNTDVRTVLNLIAEEAGINMVLDDEVGGNVTLKLREVPWDQALVLVMKSKALAFRREGIVLRIAPEEKLRGEEEKERQDEENRRISENLKVKVIPVSYAQVSDLQGKVQNFLSSRGKVTADERTSSLIITDIQEIIDRASRLIRALDVPPLQVLIEGKVVEARESFTRVFGINFGLNGTDIDIGGGASIRPSFNVTPFSSGSAASGLKAGLNVGTFDTIGDLSAFLGIFEGESMVKVVSSPRIVTLNNQAASIAQTTSFPIIATSTSGSSGGSGSGGEEEEASVTFKDVTLSLNVTPQITFEGNVILDVNVQRDFASAAIDASGAREVNTRNAKTKVLVRNGQTAVIGGIYQSDATEGEFGVPWLRNVPIIGNLFKSRNMTREKNELLIFLTPRILNTKNRTLGDDADLQGSTAEL